MKNVLETPFQNAEWLCLHIFDGYQIWLYPLEAREHLSPSNLDICQHLKIIKYWLNVGIVILKSKCPESLYRCILPRQRCLTVLSLSSDRAEITSLAPCFAASIASAAPMPVDAPVIQITCPFKSPSKTMVIYKNELIDIILCTLKSYLTEK